MKIGIVGTGNISSRHLDEFNNMPNVNVEAVCDTNQKNLEIFLSNNKKSDIRGYLSLEEMLEKKKLLMVLAIQHLISFIKKLHCKF